MGWLQYALNGGLNKRGFENHLKSQQSRINRQGSLNKLEEEKLPQKDLKKNKSKSSAHKSMDERIIFHVLYLQLCILKKKKNKENCVV